MGLDLRGWSGRTESLPPMEPVAPTGDIREQVALAVRYHEHGRRAEASALLREARRLAPDDPEALGLAGVIAFEARDHARALELLERALLLRPGLPGAERARAAVLLSLDSPDDALDAARRALATEGDDPRAWVCLGQVLRALGRRDEALRAFQNALQLDALCAEALVAEGVLLQETGQAAEGLAMLERAVALRPSLPAAQDALGVALLRAGRREEAIETLRRAVALDSYAAGAYLHLGQALAAAGRHHEAADALQPAIALDPRSPEAHTCMGSVLQALGYLDQALSAFREALAEKPDYFEAHFRAGTLLALLNREVEAVASLRAALEFRPDSAAAHAALGGVLLGLQRPTQAVTALRRALELDPTPAETWCTLGDALRAAGEAEAARGAYERAIDLDPGSPHAHRSLGLLLLALGEFARGWAVLGEHAEPAAGHAPVWEGEPLEGRTLLVRATGDLAAILRYARYLPLAAARQARVVLACPAPLHRFLEALPAVAQAVALAEPLPAAHREITLEALPRLFTRDVATLPSEAPYLPTRIWSARVPMLPSGEGLRVGIAWEGADGRALLDGEALAALATLPGITWYRLGTGAGDRPAWVPEAAVTAGMRDLTSLARDVADMAGLVGQLDLVIAVDGPVAELAGGLGVPTWVLLPTTAGWQWGADGTTSPWYPAARLFRQVEAGRWTEVVAQVRELLATLPPA